MKTGEKFNTASCAIEFSWISDKKMRRDRIKLSTLPVQCDSSPYSKQTWLQCVIKTARRTNRPPLEPAVSNETRRCHVRRLRSTFNAIRDHLADVFSPENGVTPLKMAAAIEKPVESKTRRCCRASHHRKATPSGLPLSIRNFYSTLIPQLGS